MADLTGGNPNQAGPGVPGPLLVPGAGAAGGRDNTLLLVAVAGVAVLVLAMGMRR